MIELMTIVGARPQYIKASVLSNEIKERYADTINETLVNVGQHYDHNLSDAFFEELNIPEPSYNLKIGSANHGTQTGRMMIALEKIILNENPNAILVFGDTNSTLAGALVASKLNIPLFHVEGGVRSYNKSIPEEINRTLTDHLSSIIFVPEEESIELLHKEGIGVNTYSPKHTINHPRLLNCGDIMYDLFKNSADLFKEPTEIIDPFWLLTLHRAENVDSLSKFEQIIRQIVEVAEAYQIKIVFPIHPRTLKSWNQLPGDLLEMTTNVFHIKTPKPYLEMMGLIKASSLVITDSGGLQKEAYYSKKPSVIVMKRTPWEKLVQSGNAILANEKNLVKKINEILERQENQEKNWKPIYGDGNSASIILDTIVEFFKDRL